MATDYDCWKETEEAVSVEAVIANLSANSNNAQKVLLKILPVLEEKMDNASFGALNLVRGSNMNSIITLKSKRNPDTIAKLAYILPNHFK
jgi:5'-methylthioadenosine phosphorylase